MPSGVTILALKRATRPLSVISRCSSNQKRSRSGIDGSDLACDSLTMKSSRSGILRADQRVVDHRGEVVRHLAHDAEHLAEVARLGVELRRELGELLLVGVVGGCEARAALTLRRPAPRCASASSAACWLRCVRNVCSRCVVGIRFALARRARLLQQLIEIARRAAACSAGAAHSTSTNRLRSSSGIGTWLAASSLHLFRSADRNTDEIGRGLFLRDLETCRDGFLVVVVRYPLPAHRRPSSRSREPSSVW